MNFLTKHRLKICAVVAGLGALGIHHYVESISGVPNPRITQANISQNICNRNWSTKSIRPPTSYTNPLKKKLCDAQKCGDLSKYELDHRIAITDGGDPTNPNNLWLQAYEPHPGAHEKDRLEVLINKKICSGEITLKEGQNMLGGDWLKYYNLYLGGIEGVDKDIVDEDDL